MRRAAILSALTMALAAPVPAAAQDTALYAPCLERFERLDDYIAAFEAEGWNHRTWAWGRNRAAPPLAEINALITVAPDRFQTAVAATQYAEIALERYQTALEFSEILTRDDTALSLAATRVSSGAFIVRCQFAGPSIDGFEETFGPVLRSREGLSFSMGELDVDLPDGALEASVIATRIDGDAAVLAPLTGRQGISVSVDFELLQ